MSLRCSSPVVVFHVSYLVRFIGAQLVVQYVTFFEGLFSERTEIEEKGDFWALTLYCSVTLYLLNQNEHLMHLMAIIYSSFPLSVFSLLSLSQ